MKIEGSTALVTGANRGIGLGFVQELLNQGAKRVYVGARNLADAEEVVKQAPDKLVTLQLDVANQAHIDAAAAQCGDVSLLINNAGVFNNQTLLGADSMDAMRQEMEVNHFAVVAMCRAFAPILGRNGGGAIGNVLSVGGIVAVPGMGGYSPSKFAAKAAATCMRAELADQGTTVSSLIVGSVETRMSAHVKGPKAQPVDVAREGLFAISRGMIEWDTDPMAVGARSKLALDPQAMARSMAAQLKATELDTSKANRI